MDIDIDVRPDFDVKELFSEAVEASMLRNGELVKHPCGHYFQNIPVDPVTGLSAIPFREAEALGFTKIDFLHLTLLSEFESKDEIRAVGNLTPDWTMLTDPEIVPQLFQLGKHLDTLCRIKPTSVQELADVIAIIRPNKRQYLDAYVRDRAGVRPALYRTEEDDKSSFKKSHAIAYALTVILQINLMRLLK